MKIRVLWDLNGYSGFYGYGSEFCIDNTTRRVAGFDYTVRLVCDAYTTHEKILSAKQIPEYFNLCLFVIYLGTPDSRPAMIVIKTIKRLTLLAAICVLTGCAIYKVTPDMDENLSTRGQRFLDDSYLANVEKPEDFSQYDMIQLHNAINPLVAESGKYEISIKNLSRKYPFAGKGFQCFEPYLLIISLGIIPAYCEQEYTLHIQIRNAENNQLDDMEIDYKVNSVTGWVSLFYAPSDNWNYNSIYSKNAFYTLVNELVDE